MTVRVMIALPCDVTTFAAIANALTAVPEWADVAVRQEADVLVLDLPLIDRNGD